MVKTWTKKNTSHEDLVHIHNRLRVVDADTKNTFQVRDLQELIRYHMEGGSGKFLGTIRPVEPGSVLFMTHESFLRLESGYKEDGSSRFPGRDQVHVIFDEAQKCALQTAKITIPEKLVDLLNPYLNLRDLPTDKDRIKVLQVKDKGLENLSRQVRDYVSRIPLTDTQRKSLSEMLKIIGHAYGDNVRVHAISKLEQRAGNVNLRIQAVLDPARVFYGWKSVTIMAAHLMNSQMFHMLSRADVTQGPNETRIQYTRRMFNTECKLHLQAKTVAAITRQEEALKRCWRQSYITYAAGTQSMLSKRVLARGVVAHLEPGFDTEQWNSDLLRLLKANNVKLSTRLANSLAKTAADPNAHPADWLSIVELDGVGVQVRNFLGTLPGLLQITPLQYLVQRSIFLARCWAHCQGHTPRSLPITINGSTQKNQSNEFREEVDELGIQEGKGGEWQHIPYKSQGINKYRYHEAIAFLAAVNPKRQELTTLEALCPKYNADLDHVVDQAVQVLTRCSIRMPKRPGKRLLILADEATARLVHEAGFFGLPKFIHPKDLEKHGTIGLDRAVSKELCSIASIVAIKASGTVRTQTQERAKYDKQKHERAFLDYEIPGYIEYRRLKRKLVKPRGRFNIEAATLRLAELQSSIGDLIEVKKVEFKRRWINGDLDIKPEL